MSEVFGTPTGSGIGAHVMDTSVLSSPGSYTPSIGRTDHGTAQFCYLWKCVQKISLFANFEGKSEDSGNKIGKNAPNSGPFLGGYT